jgi:hypothetical protein
MRLLKQLDRYMSHDEASRLAGVAQEVIHRHRDSLGRRFREAVSGHQWSEATQLGEAIVAEFPNTQMANEVRPMIEVLRSRSLATVTLPE